MELKLGLFFLHSLLTSLSVSFSVVYGPSRQPQLSTLREQLVDGFKSIPQRIIFLLRCIFAVTVWGLALPIVMAEVWNYVLDVDTFPMYLEETAVNWLPFSLNPVRLVVSGFKGVCITGGLFLASLVVFVLMEHIEAFLDHVAFIRQHRARRQAELAAANAPPAGPAIAIIQEPAAVEPIQAEKVDLEPKEQPSTTFPMSPRGLDLKPLWIRLPTDSWISEQPKLLDHDTIISHRKMLLDLAEDGNLRQLSEELHHYFDWRNEQHINTMGRLYNEKFLSSYWYAHYATFINQEALRKYADETSLKRRFYEHFTLIAFRMVRGGSSRSWEESESDMKLSDSSTEESKPASNINMTPRDFGPSLSEDEDDLHVPADEYDEQSSNDPLKSAIMYDEEELAARDVTRFKVFIGPFSVPEEAAEASGVAAVAQFVHKMLANKQIHAFRARRIHGDDLTSSSPTSPRGLAMADEERKIWMLVDGFIKRAASRNTPQDIAFAQDLISDLPPALAHRGFEFGPELSGSSSAPPSARLPEPTTDTNPSTPLESARDSSSLATPRGGPSGESSSSSPQVSSAPIGTDSVPAPTPAPIIPPLSLPAVDRQAEAVMHPAQNLAPAIPAENDVPMVQADPVIAPAALPAANENIEPLPEVLNAGAAIRIEEDNFDDFIDDDEIEDHRRHWLLMFFGRNRRIEDENPAENDAENAEDAANAENEDNGLGDIVGLTGNPFWSLFIFLFLIGSCAVVMTLLILVPQVVGKLIHHFMHIGVAVLSWESGFFLFDLPFNLVRKSYLLVTDSFIHYIYPYVAPYVSHPITHPLLHPTSIGFIICIAIILSMSAKRSPHAIFARTIVTHILEFFIVPVFIGTFTLQTLNPVVQLDDPMTRPPLLSRHRAARAGATSIGSSSPVTTIMEQMSVPWQRDLREKPLIQHVNETLSAALSASGSAMGSMQFGTNASLDSSMNSTLPGENLLNLSMTAASAGLANFTSAANISAIANSTAISVSHQTQAMSKELTQFIIQVGEQVESLFAYALTHYAEVFLQMMIGYVVIVAWVWTLRTLRRTVKKEVMWFLPGDPDFSPFLSIANRTMKTLLLHQSIGVALLMLAIIVFFGLPFYTIRFLNTHYGWNILRVVVPSSSFQIFTDYNVAFTLMPVVIMLIRPLTTIPMLFNAFAVKCALWTGAEDVLLIGYPRQAQNPDPPADGQAQPVPGPQQNRQMSKLEARIRVGAATFLGSVIFTLFIFGCIFLPWVVGSFFVRIWIYDSVFLPMYTGTIGLYFLTISTRIFMVYANIWKIHYASRAAIADADHDARAALRRTTFDNAFRATVLILLIFFMIPIVLGYLIRIVFFHTVLPPHVLVPLSSPMEEYVIGIMGMQLLNMFAKLPLPWLIPIRGILDTISFETILQVDYSAFLNQVVYPLATLVLILGGVPSVANTLLAYFGTDIADDALANLKRKMYALIPIFVFAAISVYYGVMHIIRVLDQLINGRVVISRQIHNFNPDAPAGNAAAANEAAPQQAVQEPLVAANLAVDEGERVHDAVMDDPAVDFELDAHQGAGNDELRNEAQ